MLIENTTSFFKKTNGFRKLLRWKRSDPYRGNQIATIIAYLGIPK